MKSPASHLNEPLDPPAPERRRQRRVRVLKRGALMFGIHESEIPCTIRNINDGGAELRVEPIDARIPEAFLLYVPVDRIGYRAIVRWRNKGRIGVEFTGTEPKPWWHYC